MTMINLMHTELFYILWLVDPLLGNDRDRRNDKKPLLRDGSANNYVSTAKIGYNNGK
jgi:hypothetical protein